MNRASLLSLLFFTFSLFACSKQETALDCPGQGDRVVDVLSGPSSALMAGKVWAFLSNEYGGRGETVEISRYPFFLNWPLGCQDEYSVSIVKHFAKSVLANAYTSLDTYGKFPVGGSIELEPALFEALIPTTRIESQTVVINNMPDYSGLEFFPRVSFDPQYDASTKTLRLDIPNYSTFLGKRHAYLAFWDREASERRAVLIDLSLGGSEYDYLTQSHLMEWQRIAVEGDIKDVRVQEVIDQSQGDMVFMGSETVSNKEVRFLLRADSRPYLIHIATSLVGTSHIRNQAYYPSLPELVQLPGSPLSRIDYDRKGFSLTCTAPIYLYLSSSNQPYTDRDQQTFQSMIGPGEQRLRPPELPPFLQQQDPDIYLPANLFEDGFMYEFWHYPAAETANDYWRMDELDQFALQNYYYERLYRRP